MIASRYLVGDARTVLATLPAGCARTCVTSPPYWGLRDYGVVGQLGIEATPEAFVATMVDVFRAVRRVLADDGTLWLNLGDSYVANPRGAGGAASSTLTGSHDTERRRQRWEAHGRMGEPDYDADHQRRIRSTGLKTKDLIGIPWMVAFALRADGWHLRSDIIWAKPNPMPESVTDRPTKSHEYLFLLSKQPDYFYDADAIREPLAAKTLTTYDAKRRPGGTDALGKVASHNWGRDVPVRKPKRGADGGIAGANKRSVWTVASRPYKGAHFATFPPALIEPCILAGSAPGDIVLDPFMGAGTTALVAERHGRRWIGVDVNPAYRGLAVERFNEGA